MKYVYPNNLMVRRDDNSDIVKGAILFILFLFVISLIFLTSDAVTSYTQTSSEIVCSNINPDTCRLE